MRIPFFFVGKSVSGNGGVANPHVQQSSFSRDNLMVYVNKLTQQNSAYSFEIHEII